MMDGVFPDITVVRRARLPRRRSRQGGFNFAEVLFAVMILGIGFIMTAAIFPVALMQTKATQEESAGASIGRGGANYLEQIATNASLPATGNQVRALDQRTDVRGMLMLAADSRYSWVPFYRRRPGDPYAQVYMIPVAARNRSNYDKGAPYVPQEADGTLGPATPNDPVANPLAPGTFGEPVLVATIRDSTDAQNGEGVDYIEFPTGAGENDTNDNYTAVAEGSYVIIANVTTPAGAAARIGHIFRIGSPTKGQPLPPSPYARRWELAAGNDYVPLKGDWNNDGDLADAGELPGPVNLDDADVFVVGRSFSDPNLGFNATSNSRDGLGQDVAAYTTFVTIK